MKKIVMMLIFLIPLILSAHPHMFVDASVEVVFNEKGIAGFKSRWIFDDMFSSSILEDYDKDKNRKLSKSEIAIIKKEAFSYTAEQSYFTRIKIGKKKFPVKQVKDFNAIVKNNRLVYTFFIPCYIAADKKSKTVTLGIYDSTFYASFEFKTKSVTFSNGKNFEFKVKKHDNTSKKYYYGQISPVEFIIHFRRK